MFNFVLNALSASMLLTAAVVDKPGVKFCESSACQVIEDPVAARLELSRQHLVSVASNDPVVMENFEAFAQDLMTAYRKEKSFTSEEIERICAAVDFAADKHRLQTRKNKEKTPYISHPIGVAYNLVHFGDVRDAAIIMGGLLHDTVEDTQTSFEELEGAFGSQVAGYVREVTDDKSLGTLDRKRMQVINAAHKSKGAAQIKLADKLYNVSDLLNSPPEGWSRTRIDRYFEWAQSVIDRLPNANEKLKSAVATAINTYWEQQKSSEEY